jgi:hypothetical protein
MDAIVARLLGFSLYEALIAQPPDEPVDRLRRRFDDPLDYLAGSLPPLAGRVDGEVFLDLSGEHRILEVAAA